MRLTAGEALGAGRDSVRAVETQSPARVNVLGVGVSAIDMTAALELISAWITARTRSYVCVSGVHGVMECQRDEDLRRIHNDARLVTPDGMPLVWIGRLRGFRSMDRVYGPELMLRCCERLLSTECRHFFYGGGEGVAELLVDRLRERWPSLAVVGTHTPPFRQLTFAEREEIARRINESEADIVWVGLSTPKQERWMAAMRDLLAPPVLIGVGAAFDFNARLKRQAPRALQRAGLEWAFRLTTEPRRLWRRYLRNNPRFLWSILLQFTGLRRYPL